MLAKKENKIFISQNGDTVGGRYFFWCRVNLDQSMRQPAWSVKKKQALEPVLTKYFKWFPTAFGKDRTEPATSGRPTSAQVKGSELIFNPIRVLKTSLA